MRIISRRNLFEFAEKYTNCQKAIIEWCNVIKKSEWKTPNDFIETFPMCVVLPNNRVIFHIKGNHYRLVVAVNYKAQRMFVKFIGTHAEYDKIDALTINQF